MSLIGMYIALYLGFGYQDALDYCYAAPYMQEVYIAAEKHDKIGLEIAKEKAEEYKKVCNLLYIKYEPSLKYE